MSLKTRITEDMKTAMKARESARLGAIRLLLAAIKQKEVDERGELDDAAVVAVIEKLTKQRKDSVTQYEAAGRQELADAEQFEITVLAAYLPEKMSAADTAAAVAALAASGSITSAQSIAYRSQRSSPCRWSRTISWHSWANASTWSEPAEWRAFWNSVLRPSIFEVQLTFLSRAKSGFPIPRSLVKNGTKRERYAEVTEGRGSDCLAKGWD